MLLGGLVTASRRRHYAVLLDGGEALECLLKGRSTTLACGDRVRVARMAGGGSIETVEPRSTLFYRSDTFKERLIAANITQVIGVVAPDLGVDEELINRWIVAAEAQDCRFVLVANKWDAVQNPQLARKELRERTDRLLPQIQERTLQLSPKVVFCAAVDRNGYLPTHNLKFSKPQGADPVWNAANCRNRRIFDDRTGLAAGRNQRRFLLQTYRRDMGGGNLVLMKDLSAPIRVDGRHWGGLRLAYQF